MEFGRMNAVLGSTPNPLAPAVGLGPVIGAAFYIDPPTEIMNAGEFVLWRLTHLGVDSHAVHFHLFDVQVVNRVDWTNTIKAPYEEEFGWKDTIRTNPFEDIILALKPRAMNLPWSIPNSNRLLDVTTPQGSTVNFQPVLPPIGLPAVAQISNVMTNFGWEYVWHCHLLGHEENDMMRPVVLTTFGISGRVQSQNGNPIPNVTMTLSGAATRTTTTDANGNYSFTGFNDGTFTVTPSKTGFTFTPVNRTVTINNADVTGVNFTGPRTYSISGAVTTRNRRRGNPVPGVTMTLTGAANAVVTTNNQGNYTFNGLLNGNYTVTPTMTGRTFTPTNRAVTVNGNNVTGVNFRRN
jgi:hypothetical protein